MASGGHIIVGSLLLSHADGLLFAIGIPPVVVLLGDVRVAELGFLREGRGTSASLCG